MRCKDKCLLFADLLRLAINHLWWFSVSSMNNLNQFGSTLFRMTHSNLQMEFRYVYAAFVRMKINCSISWLTSWNLSLFSIIVTNEHFQLLLLPHVWTLKKLHSDRSTVHNVLTIKPTRHSCVKRKNQLDATYFIIYSILIHCSTCFGRSYDHLQESATKWLLSHGWYL